MEQKICFSVFDDTVGVKVLQHDNLTEEDSTRIAIRMLSGAAGTDILREASAVMPLHDTGGVAYSFFFGIPCKSKRSPITMACLTYIIQEELQSQLIQKFQFLTIIVPILLNNLLVLFSMNLALS